MEPIVVGNRVHVSWDWDFATSAGSDIEIFDIVTGETLVTLMRPTRKAALAALKSWVERHLVSTVSEVLGIGK